MTYAAFQAQGYTDTQFRLGGTDGESGDGDFAKFSLADADLLILMQRQVGYARSQLTSEIMKIRLFDTSLVEISVEVLFDNGLFDRLMVYLQAGYEASTLL